MYQCAQRVIRPLCWFPFRGKAINIGNMSDSQLSNTEHTSHLNLVNIGEETVHETLTKFVDDTLTNIKKCLDKVLDLRVHTAELEVSLMTLYNPELLNSLEEVKDMSTSMTHLLKEYSFKN